MAIGNGKIFYNDNNKINNYCVSYDLIKSVCNKYTMFGDYTASVSNELNRLGVFNLKINFNNKSSNIPFIRDAIIGEIIYKTIQK